MSDQAAQPPSKRIRLDSASLQNEADCDNNVALKRLNPLSLASRLQLAKLDTTSAEQLVGIRGYVNASVPPISNAIIKHRFTDFLVWEISQSGEVVRLKNIARPIPSPDTTASSDFQENGAESVPSEDAENVNLLDYMSSEKLQALQRFVDAGPNDDSIISDTIASKDDRKAFHQAIRIAYNGKLVTVAQEGSAIKISWDRGDSKDRRSIRPSKPGQRSLPPYIQFTLQKTNRETQDCLSQLASRLGVYNRDLATAGTKDKRGVTTQLVTLKRGKRTIEEVWDQANGLHHGKSRGFRGSGQGGYLDRKGMQPTERGERGIRIGDLSYVKTPLDLGMLQGNRFCIVLRNVDAPTDDAISLAVETLKTTGFINFYGMQRFGNSSVPTHAIGLALLRSEWEEAARLIISERDGDTDETKAARTAWLTDRNAERALSMMPKWAIAERSLLEFYRSESSATNHYGAISRIPKNLRMMYVHAYQSYIWNSAVSERIRLYGCEKPIVGDLVYADNTTQPSEETQSEEFKQPLEHARGSKEALQAASKVAKVTVLTEDQLLNYTIHDVVLPLPGYMVTYPGGALGELYRDMMRADGLDADDLFRKQKETSLGGAYRKIVTRLSDLTWEVRKYDDANEQLTTPDEDALLGIHPPPARGPGNKTALILSFNLNTASYATMALREVLKTETGNVQQKALSEALLDDKASDAAQG